MELCQYQVILSFKFILNKKQMHVLSKTALLEDLQAWKANTDIKSTFNHFKAVTYMCA